MNKPTAATVDLERLIREEFGQLSRPLYFNHAAVAPWPRRTADAVAAFARENASLGAWGYRDWHAREHEVRVKLAGLIGANGPEDVALLKSTSEGLSFIAAGLDWAPGDEILHLEDEFPSNRMPWEALAGRGVTVRRIGARIGGEWAPEDALNGAIGPRTRLVTLSTVQYGTGLRTDWTAVGRECRDRGVLFCLDAIQSLGAAPLDVGSARADFVVADAHKWLLGPEGIALFWVRPELRERLRLQEFGWHMCADAGNYDRLDWEPDPSARRFECGSPNQMGVAALHASLSLIEDIGVDVIESRLRANVDRLIARLKSEGYALISPEAPGRRLGIVTIRPRRTDPQEWVRKLAGRELFAAARAGGLRLSPHYHQAPELMDRAVELICYTDS